ncbi:MAG: valine--tRNA ligase, partial [Ruminococcaceae bacterium]|nr:valine--tRNA ligase [Oscillospiraceae bacterium]
DMRFYVEKCEAMRNFANKIWNASRFVMMNLTIDRVELPEKLELEDKWILSKLNTLIREVTDNMDAFELGVASAKLYDFIWDNYCDWYIELTKARLNGEDEQAKKNAQNVLCYVLIETLKLLHPFMPFITEEIWQALPHGARDEGVKYLMCSKWPEWDEKFAFAAEEQAMGMVIEAISAVRARRNEMNVAPSKKVHYTVATAHGETFASGVPFFKRLASASEVTVAAADAPAAEGMVEVVTHAARVLMPLAELVDFEKELARIAKEKANAEKQLAGIEGKLKNEAFVSKAPEAVVNAEREKAEKLKALIEKLDASAKAMQK